MTSRQFSRKQKTAVQQNSHCLEDNRWTRYYGIHYCMGEKNNWLLVGILMSCGRWIVLNSIVVYENGRMADCRTLRRHWKRQLNWAAPQWNANTATGSSKVSHIWTATELEQQQLSIYKYIDIFCKHQQPLRWNKYAQNGWESTASGCATWIGRYSMRKVKLKGEATIEGEVTSKSPTLSIS